IETFASDRETRGNVSDYLFGYGDHDSRIRDYESGVDLLQLPSGISFSDLRFDLNLSGDLIISHEDDQMCLVNGISSPGQITFI
mgnify:CR=1